MSTPPDDDDDDVRALLARGDRLVKLGDDPAAIREYLACADRLAQRGPPMHLKLAAIYKQVLSLDPHRADVAAKLADVLDALGLHADAAAARSKPGPSRPTH